MEVDFAFLADAAEANNGKLYLVGGAFDTLWADAAPIIHPRLSFIMRLVFSPGDIGRRHALEVSIVDEDGRRLARVESPLEVGKNPELPPGWRQGLLSVLNFANLKFDRFGTYSFELVVDNFSLKSVLLRVAQRPKVPARD